MQEIERKFLVNTNRYREDATDAKRIVQGFLNTHPDRTVRIRIKGKEGFITIKGRSNASGTSRFEWEHSISEKEAESLLALCEEGVIEKVRYQVNVKNHIFEVDEFHGDNEGLIVAEVELKSENEVFEKPQWLGKEVTGELRYYNSRLSKSPYKTWN